VSKEFDVAVIGAGIAGLTAGLTSARLGRSTIVLTGDVLGGHLLSIEKVEGYPGFPEGVPGFDLCPMAEEQAGEAGAEFDPVEVSAIEAADGKWKITTAGEEVLAGAVVIATGTALKELNVPGEERLRGRGVSHCATCDAPLLRDQVAAIAGGGDSAAQEGLTLAEFASKVYLFNDAPELTAQASYRDLVASNPKIEIRNNTMIEEVLGEDGVTGVRIKDSSTNATEDVELTGVFVYVGLQPNTAFLDGLLALDPTGRIPVDGEMRTTLPGVFAAGTVRTGTAGRAAAAAGDGAAAAIAADAYLTSGSWRD